MASTQFDPELRRAAALLRFAPKADSHRKLRAVRRMARFAKADERVNVWRVDDDVTLRLHRPPSGTGNGGALLWVHGGGMILGSAAQDDLLCTRLARDLDVLVAAVNYRLAPEHPFPVPVDDCYAALQWLAARPEVDPARVAVGGASAGGGLSASVALAARDRALPLAGQVLIYPMLDDRTAVRDVPGPFRIWDNRSNRFAWTCYTGLEAGSPAVPPLAAPARTDDVAGLAPAWIGVGTRDLFHDEAVAYAERLLDAAVPTELFVADGAFHAFDMICPKAAVTRAFRASYKGALHGFVGHRREIPAG